MKGKYGLGLGLNFMEGREAKHVFISKYSQNTMFHSRWEQIFLHEFVSLFWLKEVNNTIIILIQYLYSAISIAIQ